MVNSKDSLLRRVEELPDAQVVPRSSSVIVKRLPIPPRTKSKIPMYVANANANLPTSELVSRQGPGGGGTWHKGALSKRFDGKEDPTPSSSAPVAVRLLFLYSELVLTPEFS